MFVHVYLRSTIPNRFFFVSGSVVECASVSMTHLCFVRILYFIFSALFARLNVTYSYVVLQAMNLLTLLLVGGRIVLLWVFALL